MLTLAFPINPTYIYIANAINIIIVSTTYIVAFCTLRALGIKPMAKNILAPFIPHPLPKKYFKLYMFSGQKMPKLY